MPRHYHTHQPNNTSLLLLLFLLFTTNTLHRCYATDEATSSAFQIPHQNDDTEDNLSELTNAELESICTSRGFELSTSSSSDDDVVYTHQDYVDAARECLAIEAEMERVMKDNPEIMKDLKDEAERLMEEKRRLEDELLAKQSELSNSSNDAGNAAGGGGGGGAFIRSSGHELLNDDGDDDDDGDVATEAETGDSTATTTTTTTGDEADETTMSGDSDGNAVPMSPPVETKKPIEMSDDDSILDLDNINDDDDDDVTTTQEITPPQNNNEQPSTSSTTPPNPPMNMTMTEFIRETFIEFRKQLEHDVNRVVTVVLPKERREALLRAVGPLLITAKKMGLGAFDLLRRYIEALVRDNSGGGREQEEVEDEGVAAAASA